MLGTSFYMIGCSTSQTDNTYTAGLVFNVANGYLTGPSRVYGAVWNDYAECRESDCDEFGFVLMENGDDTLSKTTERLSHFAGVSSDTWGFSQGETNRAKTPIAVATPFPPLNSKNIGNVCPNITIKPAIYFATASKRFTTIPVTLPRVP